MFNIQKFKNNSYLLITNVNSLWLIDTLNNVENAKNYTYEHQVQITSSTYLIDRDLIAFTDLNKKFYLIDRKTKNVLATKEIAKRAAKLIYTKDESKLVVGDKTGDLYTLKIDESSLESSKFELLMGHLSMLIDMSLSHNEKFLFTADRDEKIRISHFPNSYNIEAYLLAHKEFVIQIDFVNENRLVSASGDSKVILWNLKTNSHMQQIDVKSLMKCDDSKLADLNGIDRFDFNPNHQLLLVHVFKANFLLCFTYCDVENSFKFIKQIELDGRIDYFVPVLDNYYLFVYLDENASSKFRIKKLHNNELVELDNKIEKDQQMVSLENSLNENIKLNKIDEIKNDLEKEYVSFFKAKCNNMNYYYKQKEERIKAAGFKRKHSNSDLSSDKKLVK